MGLAMPLAALFHGVVGLLTNPEPRSSLVPLVARVTPSKRVRHTSECGTVADVALPFLPRSLGTTNSPIIMNESSLLFAQLRSRCARFVPNRMVRLVVKLTVSNYSLCSIFHAHQKHAMKSVPLSRVSF